MCEGESNTHGDVHVLLPSTPAENYVLRLYITGMTLRSTQAIERVRALCDEYLPGRYSLEVIDLYKQPELAQQAQLIASPTLIKESPLPLRRLVGSMTDVDRILGGLDLRKRPSSNPQP